MLCLLDLVFGGLIPFSILSTLLIGIWFRQTGFFPGFDVYSFITVGAVVLMGGIGGATVGTRFAGLVERIAAQLGEPVDKGPTLYQNNHE